LRRGGHGLVGCRGLIRPAPAPPRPRTRPATTRHPSGDRPAAVRPTAREAPESEGRRLRIDAELNVWNAVESGHWGAYWSRRR
jgi:hypothetical protein